MVTLAKKLSNVKIKQQPTEPVWAGPSSNTPNGGITQSLLGRFLVCRERFRLLVVKGLKPIDQFEAKTGFGNMWHVCEEALAGNGGKTINGNNVMWEEALHLYAIEQTKKYRGQQEQVQHWYDICRNLFPHYVEHWSHHPDVKGREPLFQEKVFDVQYKLPSGRTVRLRGKFDSGDFLPAHTENGQKFPSGIWIQENKSKTSIDQGKINRQVSFDLQTMIYRIALEESDSSEYALHLNNKKGPPILGTRYNVIRRSAHKSVESMLKKVEDDRKAGRLAEWFSRWKIEVTPHDVKLFKEQCLNPILENLCWWWEEITADPEDTSGQTHGFKTPPPAHWRHPFGVYNILDEGGASDLDAYLATGSMLGLQQVTNLFPELE